MKTTNLSLSILAFVPLLSSLVCGTAYAAALPDTIKRVKPSIVGVGTVQHTRRPPGKFVGTGFVVGNGRHVITNAHNIPETLNSTRKEFLAIFTAEKRGQARKAEVIASDSVHDVALLRFQGTALPALRLGDSRRVREGELYAFTGFPIGLVLGMHPVTHQGIVSAITPIVIPQLSAGQLTPKMVKRLRDPYDVFQLDATAYPGNSGSPLYYRDTGYSGITDAIPATYAEALMAAAGIKAR